MLSPIGAETLEASGLTGYVGTNYLVVEVSPDGVAGWFVQQESPINSDPQNLDMTGYAGQFARAAVSTGNLDPFTQWSNVVEVPS